MRKIPHKIQMFQTVLNLQYIIGLHILENKKHFENSCNDIKVKILAVAQKIISEACKNIVKSWNSF